MFIPNFEDELGFDVIPENMMPTKFYTISLDGWGPIKLDWTDESFNDVCYLASEIIRTFIKDKIQTHSFTRPQFTMKPDGCCNIKIGTKEKSPKKETAHEEIDWSRVRWVNGDGSTSS